MKKVIIIIIVLIALAGAAAGAGYLWYQDNVFSRSAISADQILKVEEGETLLDIAPRLIEMGLLSDETALRLFLRLESPVVNLQAGSYQITGGMNIPELIEYLNEGPQVYSVTVTVKEGLRKDEVSKVIADAFAGVADTRFKKSEYDAIVAKPQNYDFPEEIEQLLTDAKITGNLEGFLFPDTYTLGVDANALDVITLQLSTLLQRLEENNISVKSYSGLSSFQQVMNLASIVEREGYTAEEKKMIADIFLRRMEMGWALGADAPILYPYNRWTPPPTFDELQANDPYNSRIFLGLPPTPIANPGINAIIGVVSPTANNYYYFIHDSQGSIYYATTFEEHQINISNHL